VEENDKIEKYMKSMKLTLALALAAVLPLAVSASTWSTTSQYGSYTLGSYSINNDEWGSSAPQTLYVNTSSSSAPNFWAKTSQSGGGVKSYPHAAKNLNQSMKSASETGHWSQSGTSGCYDYAFDVWVPSEVMVWTQWGGGAGPWGSLYQSNVSIGGTSYNVYQPGGPWSFMKTSQSSSGSCNLGAIYQWLANGGHLGNGTVGSVQYGVEITNGNSTWTINSCSF
jgi:hypothetical protein